MDIEYKIIGGDDTEYGPASLVELKSWIRDGRVAAMTKVWRSDLSIWSPADRYTELLDELARQEAAKAVIADRAQPPAGFWTRLAAFVIDFFILALLFTVIWAPLAEARHWQMPDLPSVWTDATLHQYLQQSIPLREKVWPIFYPIYLIYDVLFNGRFGATIGKMAVGVKITMLDGSPIGYGRAFLRWLAARLSDVFFFGYLLIALRRDKRALHDLLVGTKVVYRR
jgi:uncharacterized RDD family membrane protein YckC